MIFITAFLWRRKRELNLKVLFSLKIWKKEEIKLDKTDEQLMRYSANCCYILFFLFDNACPEAKPSILVSSEMQRLTRSIFIFVALTCAAAIINRHLLYCSSGPVSFVFSQLFPTVLFKLFFTGGVYTWKKETDMTTK